MPIFEYRCSCGNEFEKIVLNTNNKLIAVCPNCGSEKPKRIMSNISIVNIKGYSAQNGYGKKNQSDNDIIKAGPEKSIERMKNHNF